MNTSSDPSKTDRETLKAVYRLSKPGAGAHTGEVAARLGVSPGTVSANLKRLASRGYVDHTPYRGTVLTKSGRKIAVAAIRRHRIVERFLADMLGYAWNEADELATAFEHDLPQPVEDRLFVALDRPTTCPHGFPIPEIDASAVPEMPPLYALNPGDVAEVAVPGSTDAQVVAFLDTLGVRPGVEVEVLEKHPFDGPIVIRVNNVERTIGLKVANQVYVTRNNRKEQRG